MITIFCVFGSNQVAAIGLSSTHIQINNVTLLFLTSWTNLYIEHISLYWNQVDFSPIIKTSNCMMRPRYFIWHLLHAFWTMRKKASINLAYTYWLHRTVRMNGNKIVSNPKPVQDISKCLQNLSIYIPEKRKDPKMSVCYT